MSSRSGAPGADAPVLIGVNYHYIAREAPAGPRAIFPVTVDALRGQIEALGRGFELVSRDQVLAAVDGGPALPHRACLITFDDGLREQHDLALPVLDELGAPAVFFPSGMPLAEGRALHVHKIHWLRERVSDDELLQELDHEVEGLDDLIEAVRGTAIESYRYDEPPAAIVKHLLNAALDAARSRAVVDSLFDRIHGDESGFCEQLYMPVAQVRELERSRRAVGAHSYGHDPLALLAPADLTTDLERSAAALEAVTGVRPTAISYPYGSKLAVSAAVGRAAAAVGFRAGFTTERALNRSLTEPLLLARLDTNDAPGGRRPLFAIGAEGRLELGDGIAPARSRHFEESAI